VLAGGQRLARDGVANMRRRADGDRIDGDRVVERVRGREGRDPCGVDAALADEADQFEIRALGDDRQMLIDRDLADADHGDLETGHAMRPSGAKGCRYGERSIG
jgi:hypothetical protein